MRFPCPQCGMDQQVDMAGTSGEALERRCRGCSAGIVVTGAYPGRKDFAGETVYCSGCGSAFPYAAACPSCMTPFTGYLLVFPKGSPPAALVAAPEAATGGGHGAHQSGQAIGAWVRRCPLRLRVCAGVLVAALTLLLAGLGWYRHLQNERGYLRNYVLVLYGIKSGFDRGRNLGQNYVEEWRRNETDGRPRPVTNGNDLADLEVIKGEVELLMRRLAEPPEPMRDAGARLTRLHAVYERQNTLARLPRGTLKEYEQALRSTDEEFSRLLLQIKTSMPQPLREEIKKAGARYNLSFME